MDTKRIKNMGKGSPAAKLLEDRAGLLFIAPILRRIKRRHRLEQGSRFRFRHGNLGGEYGYD